MDVVKQAVDCDVPSKGINERGAKRLLGRMNHGTGRQRTAWNVAYDLVRDPTVLGVLFRPEVHKIQFDPPKFHLGRLEVFRLVGVGFHSYRVPDGFIFVGLEKLGKAIRERNPGHIPNSNIDVISLGT